MVDWGRIGKAVATFGMSEGGGLRPALSKLNGRDIFSSPGEDEERRRKELLARQAQVAGAFASQSQRGYQQLGQRAGGALDYLQGQAQGQNSVSAEQLRQGLQQNIAAQQSMAAGASPQNAAMAARTAAIQAGRLGAGLAGQQAIAGLQERNQAQQQYAGLLQGLRGQDLQATLGSRGQAMGAYSPQQAGTPEKSFVDKYGPTLLAAGQLAASASDERLKMGMHDGTADANKAMAKIKPESFEYRDPMMHGSGRRVGVMAQALERAGLGHAVIDTPGGKAIHGGHLATANTAMVGALAKRLAKLEAKR